MSPVLRLLSVAGLAAVLLTPASSALAQGQGQGNRDRGDRPGQGERGNWDPEQMRQRMMERYRDQLGVENDTEWKLIETRLTKVTEARRNLGAGATGRAAGAFGRGPGGPGAAGRPTTDGQARPNRNPFAANNPELEELQQAIASEAGADQIKAKLIKYREAQKSREAALAKAQTELKEVLSLRQEAQAVVMGLLD
jgi:hypothetical protein